MHSELSKRSLDHIAFHKHWRMLAYKNTIQVEAILMRHFMDHYAELDNEQQSIVVYRTNMQVPAGGFGTVKQDRR